MSDATALSPFIEEQVASYFREGYIVARGLVSRGTLDSVMREIEKIEIDAGGKWKPITFNRDDPADRVVYHQCLIEPGVVAAVEQLLEAPALVQYGMVAVVPASGGTGLAWHQDNQYGHVLGRALNVFIALCDITDEMANLWIAPGTHLLGCQPSATEVGHRQLAWEPENGQLAGPLNAGDAVIFDRSTAHRSLNNTTDHHRYAYAAQFCESKSRFAETGRPSERWNSLDRLKEIWQGEG